MHRSNHVDLPVGQSDAERDRWTHDFRNALGNTIIAASAVRGVLQEQHYRQVDMLMHQIGESCERCMRLLETMPR
jgi:hypothetical protein